MRMRQDLRRELMDQLLRVQNFTVSSDGVAAA